MRKYTSLLWMTPAWNVMIQSAQMQLETMRLQAATPFAQSTPALSIQLRGIFATCCKSIKKCCKRIQYSLFDEIMNELHLFFLFIYTIGLIYTYIRDIYIILISINLTKTSIIVILALWEGTYRYP